MITASDFGQAVGVGKYGSQKDLILKKTISKPYSIYAPAIEWGIKYESVIQQIYEHKNQTKITEFGLLLHPTLPFFGASPDGISDAGIMLEIKVPFKRQLNNQFPYQYYYQMQGQLDVCQLNECDYVEAKIKEFYDFEYFLNNIYDEQKYQGAICIRLLKDQKNVYSYCKLSKKDLYQFYLDSIQKHPFCRFIYWQLTEYQCNRIYKDQTFFNTEIKKVEELWHQILQIRQNQENSQQKDPNNINSKQIESMLDSNSDNSIQSQKSQNI